MRSLVPICCLLLAIQLAGPVAAVDWVFDERRVTGAPRWGHIKENPTALSGPSSTPSFPLCDGTGFRAATATDISESSSGDVGGLTQGALQSPINLQHAAVDPNVERIAPNWIDANTFEVSNDGVEVLFTPKDVSPLFVHPVTKDSYKLLYWRLVAPSGHSFGSGPRSAEFQLVHELSTGTLAPGTTAEPATPQPTAAATPAPATASGTPSPTTQGVSSNGAATHTADGKYAVVIVTMDTGFGPHEYLSDLLDLIPQAPGDAALPLTSNARWNQSLPRPGANIQTSRGILSVQRILPHTGSFIAYKGSLPTPPCTEEVPYLVYADPIKISREQLAALQAKVLRDVPRQTRLAQPLGNRQHPVMHHFRRPHYHYVEPSGVRELGFTGISLAVALGFCCLGGVSSIAALFIAVLTTRKPDS